MRKIIILIAIVCLYNCKNEIESNGKLKVVTTTTMITDLVKNDISVNQF